MNWLKNNTTSLILVLIAALSASCSSSPTTRVNPKIDELVLVATTDFHAAIHKAEGLAKTVRELRQEYGDQVLHLDAGDLFQGPLEGNLSKGAAQVELFNKIKVDAMAIGNHELDHGPKAKGRSWVKPGEDGLGNLKEQIKKANYFWLSANMLSRKGRFRNALGQKTLFRPRAIFLKGRKKVCVIGATTPETPNITRQEFIKNVKFAKLEKVIAAEAQYSREKLKCKLVILLAHAGLDCEDRNSFSRGNCQKRNSLSEILYLLEALPRGTLDAVVAGHAHVLAQEIINGTPVIQAGAHGKHVGVLKISVSEKEPEFEDFIDIETIEPFSEESVKDISIAMEPYRKVANEKKKVVVGSTAEEFIRGYRKENALGNLVADAILDFAKQNHRADFAMVNAGGIRTSIPKGEINYGHTYQALPFDNRVTVVKLKGSEIRTLIEIGHSGAHGASPVSGIKIRKLDIDSDDEDSWTRDLNQDGLNELWERNVILGISLPNDQPIDDEKYYRLATIDFLADGGDHQKFVYSKVQRKRKKDLKQYFVRDVINAFLKTRPMLKNEMFYNPAVPRVELTTP